MTLPCHKGTGRFGMKKCRLGLIISHRSLMMRTAFHSRMKGLVMASKRLVMIWLIHWHLLMALIFPCRWPGRGKMTMSIVFMVSGMMRA